MFCRTFRTIQDVQEDAVIGRRVPTTCRKRDFVFARTRNAVVTSPERDQPELTVYDYAVLTTVIPTSTLSAEHGKNYDYASPTRTDHTVRDFWSILYNEALECSNGSLFHFSTILISAP